MGDRLIDDGDVTFDGFVDYIQNDFEYTVKDAFFQDRGVDKYITEASEDELRRIYGSFVDVIQNKEAYILKAKEDFANRKSLTWMENNIIEPENVASILKVNSYDGAVVKLNIDGTEVTASVDDVLEQVQPLL